MLQLLFRYIYLGIVGLCFVFVTACSNEEITENTPMLPHCYRMRLVAACPSYDPETRAAIEWPDGAQVYLRFVDTSGDVTGIAIYHAAEGEWEVNASAAVASIGGICKVYYFRNPTFSTSTKVSLTSASVTFEDAAATFELVDDQLIVRALLTPKTGRLRLKGEAGRSYVVSGLSSLTDYAVTAGSFSSQPLQLTGTIGSDGYSPFYHVFFTGDQTLVVGHDATSSFKATFTNDILLPGTSGAITLPTAAQPGYWTLVNSTNLLPITLPALGAVEIVNVWSTSATLTVAVNSTGNGTISEAGVVYATSPSPTLDTGTKVVATVANNAFTLHLTGIEPQTIYYARAFLTNEKGTVYAPGCQFTTLSKEEDGSNMEKDGYGEDESLNDVESSGGTIIRDGYEEDDNLNY